MQILYLTYPLNPLNLRMKLLYQQKQQLSCTDSFNFDELRFHFIIMIKLLLKQTYNDHIVVNGKFLASSDNKERNRQDNSHKKERKRLIERRTRERQEKERYKITPQIFEEKLTLHSCVCSRLVIQCDAILFCFYMVVIQDLKDTFRTNFQCELVSNQAQSYV